MPAFPPPSQAMKNYHFNLQSSSEMKMLKKEPKLKEKRKRGKVCAMESSKVSPNLNSNQDYAVMEASTSAKKREEEKEPHTENSEGEKGFKS